MEEYVPEDLNWRDYSLTGPEAGNGFAPAHWYSSPVPRKRMKQLMQRRNGPALINYGIWLALVALTGFWLVQSWGTPWAIAALFFYGIFYGSCADSRWHETSHGTVFKTPWLNQFFYQLASFMALKNPYLWRWSHTRHHTDTVVVGRDPEIAFPRPPSLWGMVLNLMQLRAGVAELKKMLRLSFGLLTEDQKSFLIEADRSKTFRASQLQLAILVATGLWAISAQSWLPVILIGTPTFYGSWLHHILASTQHAGLAEDIPDHRMNSRTVRMNPFFRFVYSNMNYHVEHHMYPMVPFYSLPALHQEIRSDCPPAYRSTLAAYREMIPALRIQRRDPYHYVRRPLPASANPTPDYMRPVATAAE
jgi:fatty acid desaturase